MIRVVRQSSIGAQDEHGRSSDWSIRVASLGAVAFCILLPAFRIYSIVVTPASIGGIHGRAVYAVAAVACYLPVQVWLVLSAARRAFGRWHWPWLGVLAAVMFGMIPVVGVGWLGILYMLGALLLAGVNAPWSLLLYGALVATLAPMSFALGQPEWAAYYTVGMLIFGVPFAVGIRLIRVARQVQEARVALAEQAVICERLRIDEEVRASVGARLAEIAAMGGRVGELAASDPVAAGGRLRSLVDDARRTLAETRRMVTRYREGSVVAELRTIATLLSAGGIDVHLDLPPRLPDVMDERDRESLRWEVARLLAAEPGLCHPVSIAAAFHGGRLHVELATHPGPEAVTVAAR